MISNWFYYCLTLLASILILSSCLDTNDIEYEVSSDAQITSLKLSSRYDTLNILPDLHFSINQISDEPLIYNKDSLPYQFDISTVKVEISDNGASGIKFHLNNPDSSYIWNLSDSVLIKRLNQIEVYAQDGVTKKIYNFKLAVHQQDPDSVYWQKVSNNYIPLPSEQATVSNKTNFFTYYKTNNTVKLVTSLITDGKSWTNQHLNNLPLNVELKSIQNNIEESGKWFALDSDNQVHVSNNGTDWTIQSTAYPVKTILGKLPSYTKDSILVIIKDADKYKFAKTGDFTSIRVLNEAPNSFPVRNFTSTTIKESFNYTAKYMLVYGGNDRNNILNNNMWMLQESDNKISFTSKELEFNASGASLFNYDNKIYLMTSVENKNKFYTSTNYGVDWEEVINKQSLPLEFTFRKNQSVNIDNKNNIWIFGGVSANETQLVEVWKGRINRLYVK